jgi:hypothetical protein
MFGSLIHLLSSSWRTFPPENGCKKMMKRRERGQHLEKCPASVVTCTMEWNRWPMWYHLSSHGHSNHGMPNPHLPFYCGDLKLIQDHLGKQKADLPS